MKTWVVICHVNIYVNGHVNVHISSYVIFMI
jgi:hypothetical protein